MSHTPILSPRNILSNSQAYESVFGNASQPPASEGNGREEEEEEEDGEEERNAEEVVIELKGRNDSSGKWIPLLTLITLLNTQAKSRYYDL